MASIYNLVSTERDIITQFASDFTSKQSEILADVATLQAQIDAAVQVENAETATLCQIQSQLDGLSLANTLASLSAVDADLNAKFTLYTDLVQNNNAVATDIYGKLQASAGLIANVQNTVTCLKSSVSSISATLVQYSNRASSTSSGPVVIPSAPVVVEPVAEQVAEQVAVPVVVEPVVEEVVSEPVAEEVAEPVVVEPVVEEVAVEPVVEEVVSEPVVEEVAVEPVAEEVLAEVVAEEAV